MEGRKWSHIDVSGKENRYVTAVHLLMWSGIDVIELYDIVILSFEGNVQKSFTSSKHLFQIYQVPNLRGDRFDVIIVKERTFKWHSSGQNKCTMWSKFTKLPICVGMLVSELWFKFDTSYRLFTRKDVHANMSALPKNWWLPGRRLSCCSEDSQRHYTETAMQQEKRQCLEGNQFGDRAGKSSQTVDVQLAERQSRCTEDARKSRNRVTKVGASPIPAGRDLIPALILL